ncbi:MAG: hypothetical protein HKM24_07965 [Gammaproteobacteria bacterium]|nr:hypothetical protein [Gammaproteobacteria bacterium]
MNKTRQISNDPFEQNLRRQLQTVIADIDEETARELQQARRRALARQSDRRQQARSGLLGGLWQPVWAGVAATALVGVFAMWWAVTLNDQRDISTDSIMPVLDEDFDLLIALEESALSVDASEDLDFYAWLLQTDLDELEQLDFMQAEGELG